MTRYIRYSGILAFCMALISSTSQAQSSGSSSSQSSSSAPATSPAQTPDGTAPAPADAKKTKKVWTNDDVHGLSGPVSVVGNSKNLGKGGTESKADGQYIANARKELAKLQSQMEDTKK